MVSRILRSALATISINSSFALAGPVKVAEDLQQPLTIAVESHNVYWSDLDRSNWSGTIKVRPYDLSVPTKTIVKLKGNCHTIIPAGDTLFVTDTDGDRILKVDVLGNIKQVIPTPMWPIAMIKDGDRLYVSTQGQEVVEYDISTGTEYKLLTGIFNSFGMTQDANFVYVAGQRVVNRAWVTEIIRISKTTRVSEKMADDNGMPYGLVVDEKYLYWTSYDSDGALRRVPIDGGTVETLAKGLRYATALAIDATSVFVGEKGRETINIFDKLSGQIKVLFSGMEAFGIQRMVRGDSKLFWVNESSSGDVVYLTEPFDQQIHVARERRSFDNTPVLVRHRGIDGKRVVRLDVSGDLVQNQLVP